MNTTAMAHPIAGTTTTGWDLEHSLDHLADIVKDQDLSRYIL